MRFLLAGVLLANAVSSFVPKAGWFGPLLSSSLLGNEYRVLWGWVKASTNVWTVLITRQNVCLPKFSLIARRRSSSTLQSSNPNESIVTRSGDSDPAGGGQRGNDNNRNRGPNNRGPNNRGPSSRGPNSSYRGPNPNYRGPNRGPGRGPPAASMKLENPMKIQRVAHVHVTMIRIARTHGIAKVRQVLHLPDQNRNQWHLLVETEVAVSCRSGDRSMKVGMHSFTTGKESFIFFQSLSHLYALKRKTSIYTLWYAAISEVCLRKICRICLRVL